MRAKLLQLEQRVKELEVLADEVGSLAEQLTRERDAQPSLSIKGQAWFRGARELLVQQRSSALAEFDECYIHHADKAGTKLRHVADIENYTKMCTGPNERIPAVDTYHKFVREFRKARSLLSSALEEVKSRELPVLTFLSFALSENEFEKASSLLQEASGDDVIIRASGVVARVALERHLFTVSDSRGVAVPPSRGKKPEASDAINALKKADLITAIQKSELESLFTIANHCAHPKEAVSEKDVSRLIQRGRELASVIL